MHFLELGVNITFFFSTSYKVRRSSAAVIFPIFFFSFSLVKRFFIIQSFEFFLPFLFKALEVFSHRFRRLGFFLVEIFSNIFHYNQQYILSTTTHLSMLTFQMEDNCNDIIRDSQFTRYGTYVHHLIIVIQSYFI